MKQKKKSDVAVLLDYAGSHKGLTFLGPVSYTHLIPASRKDCWAGAWWAA